MLLSSQFCCQSDLFSDLIYNICAVFPAKIFFFGLPNVENISQNWCNFFRYINFRRYTDFCMSQTYLWVLVSTQKWDISKDSCGKHLLSSLPMVVRQRYKNICYFIVDHSSFTNHFQNNFIYCRSKVTSLLVTLGHWICFYLLLNTSRCSYFNTYLKCHFIVFISPS